MGTAEMWATVNMKSLGQLDLAARVPGPAGMSCSPGARHRKWIPGPPVRP